MRRIDHLLSSLGYASRREARAWVADGRVTLVLLDRIGHAVLRGDCDASQVQAVLTQCAQ